MKKWLMIAATGVLIVLLGVGGFFIYKTTTPEYALLRIINDTKTSGLSGLKPHLTENALKTVNSVEEWSENSGILGSLTAFATNTAAGFLKSKVDDIDWSLEDVLRGKNTSEAVIGFNYKDLVTGTISIRLVKENGEWKIGGFGVPSITK